MLVIISYGCGGYVRYAGMVIVYGLKDVGEPIAVS